MPALNRVMADKELQRMIQLYLQAETDIINEMGRLRSLGLVDYHAEAALRRVQAILQQLERDGWEYVPQMIERRFYVHHPERRRQLDVPETVEKHRRGYANAALTGEQMDIVQRLTMNLMGQLVEANATAYGTLAGALLGRTEPDVFRIDGGGEISSGSSGHSAYGDSYSQDAILYGRSGNLSHIERFPLYDTILCMAAACFCWLILLYEQLPNGAPLLLTR